VVNILVVPKFIRDAVYNLIAKNHKWFGKKRMLGANCGIKIKILD
jgi:predicted DCC family thiol-disulfide oxidoreductase YuxK